ncbi:MAG: Cof-type HAD-IIB family hydrolase [Candidatus Rokubacteria bacterium]|nr:Cof-type HAD-IIB family hydrolase [Candidatus Rokubacteria bacterium]
MAYRLVVADLDGTMRSRALGITPGVRAAVAAAQARGVRVCVATGRMWPSAAPWVKALGADSPVILYNGGQVFDFVAGRVLFDRRLPRAVARQALALLRREGRGQVHLYLNDRVYVERPDPVTEAYAADDGVAYEVVPAFEPLLSEDPYKMLVIGPPDRMEALGRAVREAGVPVHVVQSEPQYLEILPAGVSKGAALRAMLAALGIPAEEVVAVGDNWNDLEMIEAAGLGVAMGHAPAGVRARADHVCGTSEEEGFREAIERFVLDGR